MAAARQSQDGPSHYTVTDPEALIAALEANGEVRIGRESRRRVTYLDTFDGSLYRAGSVLAALRQGTLRKSEGWRLEWRDLEGELRAAATSERLPTFAGTLPAGPMADALDPLIDIRSLLPLAAVDANERRLEILDKRRKIVVRLSLMTGRTARDETPALLSLQPVKGYDRAADALRRVLAEVPGVAATDSGEVEVAFAAAGLRAGQDPSTFRPQFEADDAVGDAIRQALARLLEVVRDNRDGTRRDLDSEFLHDLRVAVRRSRSILALLEDYLPSTSRSALAAELKWLGGVTGPTRDLDVYLLKLDDYRAPLAPAVQTQLEPLLALLARRRKAEQKRLARALDSRRFHDLLERWQRFCEAPGEEPESADTPVRQAAARLLRRARKRLLKKGRAIDERSPNEALHRLRIDGKKLRYLLELFRSLFPAGDFKTVLRALKGLQDVLGDFNDLCVHQEAIAALAAELDDANALMATGRLIEHLAARAEDERQLFAERFAELDSPKLDAIFRRFEGRSPR